MLRPHVVILGAGFGGVYVAKKLVPRVKAGEIDVTIVNRTNYFLFTPLLHEVATGSLGPSSVAEPLREIFAHTGVGIIQGTILSVDPTAKVVKLSSCVLEYDYLIIATGADSNYYDISGAEKFSYPLKNLADAVRIRSRIIDVFEQAVLVKDPAERSRLTSFGIVGGGATGVEVAAELADFVHGIADRYYNGMNAQDLKNPIISLVHTGPELLQPFAPSLRIAAQKRLTENGVTVYLNTMVNSVTKDGLNLSNNTSIPAATVIWAAGVKANIPHFENNMPAVAGGRMVVDEYFRLPGNDRIFALGDTAGYIDVDAPHAPDKPPASLPMLAQVAEGQAKLVAYNIIASVKNKKLKPFHYHSKGSMVSVGQWFAVGEIYSLNIVGHLTWWLWRTIYLFKFASWKKRTRIAFEWTLGFFYPRDITKLG